MGNAIFVAAYLIMALFLTLERLIDSVASLLSEEKGTHGRCAARRQPTSSSWPCNWSPSSSRRAVARGGGLAAGSMSSRMLGMLLLGRAGRPAAPRAAALAWRAHVRPVWLGLIGLTRGRSRVPGRAQPAPGAAQSGVRTDAYIGRMGTLFSTTEGTNAVRVLIWEGVVDMMLKPHAPIQYPDGPRRTPECHPPAGRLRAGIDVGGLQQLLSARSGPLRGAATPRPIARTTRPSIRWCAPGLIGFGIQLWLYISIFYYALRWLGLMDGRKQRNMFLL